MLRSVVSVILSFVMTLGALRVVSAASQATGEIAGVALSQNPQGVAGHIARLRSLDGGSIVSVTTTNASGNFSFSDVPLGSYVVEIVANGYIGGTSGPVVLTDRDNIAESIPVTLTSPDPEFLSIPGLGGFWGSTGGLVVSSAILAGLVTTAIVVVENDASESR